MPQTAIQNQTQPPPSIDPGRQSAAWRRLGAIARRVWRPLLWLAAAGYFGFAALILVLRYAVLPDIDHYRDDIAQLISQSVGLRTTIAGIDAYWHGLRPGLSLHGVQVHDAADRPALAFDNVDTELSWTSLLHWQLRLRRLEINAPTLAMRRETNGHIFVAGIQMNTEQQGGDFSDWLLAQGSIVIRDATIQWQDLQRGAPPLELKKVNFRLENLGSHHRFGFTAEPPGELATRIDVRGDFRGRDFDQLQDWRGEAYAALDFADLAGWRAWVDYPVEAQGAGGLRLWLDVDAGRVVAATADVALRDASLRLRHDLPVLELRQLAGRVSARLPQAGFEASAKKLTLDTRDGIHVAPTDVLVRFAPAQGRKPGFGEVTANRLDFEALDRLAAFLPLDEATRGKLAAYTPRGRLDDLKLSWNFAAEMPNAGESAVTGYNVRARFDRLGMRSAGIVPGFGGMSGTLEASERGGTVTLASRAAMLEMPKVFPEPRLDFEQLNAQAKWSIDRGVVDVQLQNLTFTNNDATGTASGRFSSKGRAAESPGEIDLTARLTHAAANSVWRYMPLVVHGDVPDWLRASLIGGKADDARLRLKGDLLDFPYADGKSGTFQVVGKISGGTLRYAPSWPEIEGISGDLLFEGNRMLIRASRANIYGAQLSGVSAEIPDLGAPHRMLRIKGRAGGPTSDFLHFIDTSPVAEKIDRFTSGMQAQGDGSLQLQIAMPLDHVDDTSVVGEYTFVNNRVLADAAMPPMSEVNGRLQFTEKGITVRSASANMLGAPLSLAVGTRADGSVAIDAQGGATVAGLRQQYDTPLLEHLSGTATWRGTLLVRKRAAEVVIESNLQGISSSLPQPFNKTAADTLPLRIERRAAADDTPRRDNDWRDVARVSLGRSANVQLVLHHQGDKTAIERGVINLSDNTQQSAQQVLQDGAALPERGVLLAGNLRSLNVDAWRRLLGTGEGSAAPLPVTAVNLRANEVTAYGRQFNDISLRATQQEKAWQAQVNGREIVGELNWIGQGRGRLHARLKQFSLGEAKSPIDAAAVEEPLRELPGLDVVIDNFTLRGKPLGRLEMLATNLIGGANVWQIDKLNISNADGSLSGTGQWRSASSTGANAADTQLDFKLETGNIGKLLERLGYADAVRRGSAKLEGKIAWNGAPTSIHYPTLSGAMSVEARSGQFNKLEPGVGRLLGILSLQSLPRRITLDFRDVFSEGFAFDTIAGDVKVTRGVMATQNLQIQGPSAKILMKGNVNLAGETQDLRVRVQPTLSESVALGAALANPLAGVATLLAQKALRDPLEQIFSYQYGVTGSWADPKVEKIQATAAKKQE